MEATSSFESQEDLNERSSNREHVILHDLTGKTATVRIDCSDADREKCDHPRKFKMEPGQPINRTNQ